MNAPIIPKITGLRWEGASRAMRATVAAPGRSKSSTNAEYCFAIVKSSASGADWQTSCAISTLSRAALEKVEMEPEVCVSAAEALDLTVVRHYSALVLDFDLPGAATVARMARLAPSSRRPVIFGMIGASTEIAETFQAGVNFIIYKPLASKQIVRCLRAGRGFMRPDRRQSQRQPLESLVYLQFGIASLPAMVLDLNQNGLALQAPEPLPPVQQVPLRFVLPGTANMVEGMGEVIWADDGGRAGMLFSQLTPASRKFSEAVVCEARRQEEA